MSKNKKMSKKEENRLYKQTALNICESFIIQLKEHKKILDASILFAKCFKSDLKK